MFYQRFAATAAALLLLGGCSFLGSWDAPESPAEVSNIDSHGTVGPLDGTQPTALPGYRSDQDVTPGGLVAVRGYVGISTVRPARSIAAIGAAIGAAVQVQPLAREMNLKDLLPEPQVLDFQPIAAAFGPDYFSLADLVVDWDWRRRTSVTLDRLFQ